MYNTLVLVVTLCVLALLLTHYTPMEEGFANVNVSGVATGQGSQGSQGSQGIDCTQRSSAAQRILASIAHLPETDEGAAELRLLLSKMTCIEADISTPGRGVYRTLNLQFRTSHEMEPATTFVGRCLRNAVRKRDIDLILDKFEKRGTLLIKSRCAENLADFQEVVTTTRLAMVSFCLAEQPSMDRPTGVRDPGFWEPDETDLRQYEGYSASK